MQTLDYQLVLCSPLLKELRLLNVRCHGCGGDCPAALRRWLELQLKAAATEWGGANVGQEPRVPRNSLTSVTTTKY